MIICLCSLTTAAQSEYARQLRQGNKAYADSVFADAEAAYRISAKERPDAAKPHFNLGDALYRQERFEEAIEAYQSGFDHLDTDDARANALHNMGNAHFKMEEYQKAAKAYQEALKLNPNDDETRYNLAQSIRRLRMPPPQQQQQEQQQQEGDDDQQDDDQQNGSSSQQEPQDEQNDQQQEQAQGDEADDQQSGQQQMDDQGQAEKLNREEAERLLDALQKEEEDLRARLQKEERPAKKVKTEKDW